MSRKELYTAKKYIYCKHYKLWYLYFCHVQLQTSITFNGKNASDLLQPSIIVPPSKEKYI